ncbi:MAG: 2,3-bisphosphoglycerate-independent phosphoglycerate mutase [Bacillota bacterium]|nr:MAG: 2,3-bisphosphoglycerate-independent phosphoglycerate mutase [Bacillota bacterium]
MVILDGWGVAPDMNGNAVRRARTPNMDEWMSDYPHTVLGCAGLTVGLTDGQMGNSNVGHLNLGAGRVVYQDLARIDRAIADGDFYDNPILLGAARVGSEPGRRLHLMGLVSPGGVHSHQRHLHALLGLAARAGTRDLVVHAFLDGRDVPPKSALPYLDDLEAAIREAGAGRVATVAGRYYAMDRDRRWDRTAKAYRGMVAGEGRTALSAREAVERAYDLGETDEFVEPTVIVSGPDGVPVGKVREGDAVVFFNFRPDRARQLTRAFVFREFDGFERPGGHLPLHFVTMTLYDATFPVPVAFPPEAVRNTLGEVVSKAGLRQLRIAETEKYAHVTYFFSGGEERPFPGEDRCLIPSPKVSTYDRKPEMSAPAVASEAVERIASDVYDLVVLNFANADMVGHTGDFSAAVKAVEAVDRAAGRVVRATLERGGVALVLSDHGNAERMIDLQTGQPQTAHTVSPVPFALVGASYRGEPVKLRPGILADVAPTVLDIMGLEKPREMTGQSLLEQTGDNGGYDLCKFGGREWTPLSKQ